MFRRSFSFFKKAPVCVCALGGNALKQPGQKGTLSDMLGNAASAAPLLAKIKQEMGYDLVLTHGNGPQVGDIFLQNEMAKSAVPMMPLYICGAQTQGQLGYVLQTTLEAELNKPRSNDNKKKKNKKPAKRHNVVEIGTRVRVDKEDPAFQNPSKPIGSFYSAEEAEKMKTEEGKTMVEDKARGGWRVVVPSPEPVEIMEAGAIHTMLHAGNTVIACGGGGIPVVYDAQANPAMPLHGIDAVIDKDLSAERLAFLIRAQLLIILTDIDGVYLDFKSPSESRIENTTAKELRESMNKNHFVAGSMRPKVEACCRFVESNPKGVAYITSLGKLSETLHGKAGTCIRSKPLRKMVK